MEPSMELRLMEELRELAGGSSPNDLVDWTELLRALANKVDNTLYGGLMIGGVSERYGSVLRLKEYNPNADGDVKGLEARVASQTGSGVQRFLENYAYFSLDALSACEDINGLLFFEFNAGSPRMEETYKAAYAISEEFVGRMFKAANAISEDAVKRQ